MTNSIETNSEKFQQLPRDAQAAIQRFEYDKALKAIHSKYKLHIDQAAALEKALADIIFGESRPGDLVHRLENELRIEQELSRSIATDINADILKPIQDLMRQIQEEEV